MAAPSTSPWRGAVLGVADALAAAVVELVATGHGAAADGGIGLEGDAHQAELQQARQAGPARGSGAAAGDKAGGVVVVRGGVEHWQGLQEGQGSDSSLPRGGSYQGT